MGFNIHKPNYRTCDDWMRLIQECRSSGLCDKDWCLQNDIAISSFYAAIRRCRKNACKVPATTKSTAVVQEVVPVTFDEPIPAVRTISPLKDLESFATIQVIVNDYKIQISDNCAKETIKNTLLALREIC